MNKMINPRSGHGPAFGIEILYALVAMILGWPVAIPLMAVEMFISDNFHYKLPIGIFWVGCIVGIYVHYKLWAWIYSVIKAWRSQ